MRSLARCLLFVTIGSACLATIFGRSSLLVDVLSFSAGAVFVVIACYYFWSLYGFATLLRSMAMAEREQEPRSK
jgi:hypothetical protein